MMLSRRGIVRSRQITPSWRSQRCGGVSLPPAGQWLIRVPFEAKRCRRRPVSIDEFAIARFVAAQGRNRSAVSSTTGSPSGSWSGGSTGRLE
jgi:hypothetical protein